MVFTPLSSWVDVKKVALLGLVGKMYSKIQYCRQASGRNHRDTEDTKIDLFYSNL